MMRFKPGISVTTPLRSGPWAFCVAGLLVLAGCEDLGSFGGGGASAPSEVRVSSKRVVISGPQGYCIDNHSLRDSEAGAFVLLGSCAAISKSHRAPAPRNPAILVASVANGAGGVSIEAAMARFERFFNTDAGRAALSREGRAETVDVLTIKPQGDVLYLNARDRSEAVLPGAGAEYWRAIFDVNGQIVTASVVGLKDKPISKSKGFSLIKAFVGKIRAKNPEAGGLTDTAPKKTSP